MANGPQTGVVELGDAGMGGWYRRQNNFDDGQVIA